jgi:hypothetical protein
MEIFNKLKKTFPNLALFTLANELEYLLKDCGSILDIGCGDNSPLRLIDKKGKYLVGADIFHPVSKKQNIHDRYYKMNVLDINKRFKNKSFDAVVALDLIEHLTKEKGYELLKKMELVAKKRIIILTPNGFMKQTADENKFQEHLSGWSIKDFKKGGFKVGGLYGLKYLRGEKAGLRLEPKVFWGIISELTHYLYTKKHPKYSYSLLAYKNINDKKNNRK